MGWEPPACKKYKELLEAKKDIIQKLDNIEILECLIQKDTEKLLG